MTNKCPECGIEIDDHPAGRCLDRWIVEQVFGLDRMLARHNLRDGEIYYHWGYPIGHGIAPFYSSDIAAAWDVVEKIGHTVEIFNCVWKISPTWVCKITEYNHRFIRGYSNSSTAPLAICRAAIKAVAKER